MKKINESLFLSKLNDAQDNNFRRFYCELIETQSNFDSEYKIEKLYYMCKIFYENNHLLQTIDISNTIITYIKYFLDNLNYTPLPRTLFYLNSSVLMTMKLLIDSNLLSNICILYSKYLKIIKDQKIKEIIKSNKSVRYTKKSVINLFKEAKNKLQEQLNTRKDFFSILNSNSTDFDKSLKSEVYEFLNSIRKDISEAIGQTEINEENSDIQIIINKSNKDKDKNNNEDNAFYYAVSSDWLKKLSEFLKFFNETVENVENYKYFLFTGFDADNVINIIINNYKKLNNKIVSYIGPIINENCMVCMEVLQDPNKEYNDYILTNEFIYINEELYNKISDFFGIDFEIKRQKKNFNIKFMEMMIFNKSLHKRNISSICKEMISFKNDITYTELKDEIIRCIKSKYEIDFNPKDNKNKINIYIYEYNDTNDKEFLNNQNFQLLLAYGLELVDKLYISANIIDENNYNNLLNEGILTNNSFLYIEILDNTDDTPFIVSDKKNICIFCNNEIKINDNDDIFICDENEKCLNKYCSNECKTKDKKHVNFHNEINKYFIQRISLEQLLNEEISLPKNSKMGLTGLVNIGNTCYMNSAIQCLSNCFQLTKYFLSNSYQNEINTQNRLGSGGKIARLYKKLLKQIWKNEKEYIYPNKFHDVFIQYERQFSGFGQHDSNEFLIFLLDKLHEDLNRISKKEYIEIMPQKYYEDETQSALRYWKSHLKREDSIIVNLFHGQFKNRIICDECGKISIIYDPFMILSLPIPSGKYNLMIKYFGYNPSDFHEFNIHINEKTIAYDIEKRIIEELSKIFEEKKMEKRKVNKNINKKRKINKRKIRGENTIDNNIENYTEESINGVELVLLTKDKKIYRALNEKENIFEYINKGYEIVSYEKEVIKNKDKEKNTNNDIFIDNIYFYLIRYTNEHLLWIYPYIYENVIFKYPLPISIKSDNTIFNIYEKIYIYLRELKLFHYFQKEELLNINDSFNNISYRNEKSAGFLIYINNSKVKKSSINICSKIFNFFRRTQQNFRILEKFSPHTKFSGIKEKLKLYKNKRLILNIDLKYDIDINKLPELNNNKKSKNSSDIDLYDCLNLFNGEEKIEDNIYYCNKCKKRVVINKKMDIYKEPYYLIIHLKRFKNGNDINNNYIFNFFNKIKNNAFIDFPIQNLDLTKYILRNNNKKIQYNLIGIINHSGGPYYGHYTASCLNRNKWYKFNDEIVSSLKEEKIVTDSAYVLFYQRINQ